MKPYRCCVLNEANPWLLDRRLLGASWILERFVGVVRTRLESIVIFLIILIAKHDGVGMNCQYNQ